MNEQRRQRVVNKLSRMIQISDAGSQQVKIRVEGEEPAITAELANAFGHAYIDNFVEAQRDMAREAATVLTEQLNQIRQDLEESRQEVLAFQERENLVGVNLRDITMEDGEGVETLTAQALSDLTARLVEARNRAFATRSRFDSAGKSADGYNADWEILPSVLRDELAQALKHDVAKAQSDIAEGRRRFGSEDSEFVAAQSRLESAIQAYQNRVKQIVSSFEKEYDQAIADQRQVEQELERARQEFRRISSKQYQLRELWSEVEHNQELYDTYLMRFREVKKTDLQQADARFVTEAQPSYQPVERPRMMITGLAGMLSLMLAVMAAFLRAALNNTVKVAGELERKVGLNVLGVVPLATKLSADIHLPQLYMADGHHAFAESIGSLRTSLVLSRADAPHKVMVVTSSIAKEGKTTIACNLALAMGQLEKVLLIDADMRSPRLSGEFGLADGTRGLVDLLTNNSELADCIQSLDSKGIDLMAAGAAAPNALDLLSSDRFAEVLEELKTQYDRIIIDSTAIQAVRDALVLSTHADALIYVVKANTTDINVVQNGIKRLLDVDAPLLGAVLNEFDPARAPRHGRDGYVQYSY